MYSCLACWGGFPIVVTVDACLIGLLVARSRVGAPLHQVLQARRPLVWRPAWTDDGPGAGFMHIGLQQGEFHSQNLHLLSFPGSRSFKRWLNSATDATTYTIAFFKESEFLSHNL